MKEKDRKDRFIGTPEEMVLEEEEKEEILFPQCIVCKHLIDAEAETCDAYPAGIPEKFFLGTVSHNRSVVGDRGIIFEPINEIISKEA